MPLHTAASKSANAVSRRPWWRALLIVASTAALLAGDAASSHAGGRTPAAGAASPYGAMTTMYEGAMEMQVLTPSGKAPTWKEVSTVYTELSAARAATAKYQNVNIAVEDGYHTVPILRVAEQGYHYFNQQYVREWQSGHHDYSHPPVLVYNNVNGRMVLSGLMYLVPWDTTPRQLASIFPASMAGWHRHINNCIQGSEMNGKLLPYHTRASCQAHGGTFHARAFGWMTHAWIWNSNPGTGLFDMDMNPAAPMSAMPGM